MFGVSFLGMESRILNLLEEIESRYQVEWNEKKREKKVKRRQRDGESRELKRLQWSVNYGRKKSSRKGEGVLVVELFP